MGFTEVLRDYNVRKALPAAELSISEKEHWVAAISDFFKPPEESQSKKRGPRALCATPAIGRLRVLSRHQQCTPSRRRCLSYYRVEWPEFEERLGAEDPTIVKGMSSLCPMLVINMDQGPPRLAATSFLAWSLAWSAAAHRCWNGVKLALRHCGLMGVTYSAAVLFNYRSGPWDRSWWYVKWCATFRRH